MQEMGVLSLGGEDALEKKWHPTPIFLLGNPVDKGIWKAIVHGVAKESDVT